MNGLPLIKPGHLRVVPMREGPTLQYKLPCGTEAKPQQPKNREDGEHPDSLSLQFIHLRWLSGLRRECLAQLGGHCVSCCKLCSDAYLLLEVWVLLDPSVVQKKSVSL